MNGMAERSFLLARWSVAWALLLAPALAHGWGGSGKTSPAKGPDIRRLVGHSSIERPVIFYRPELKKLGQVHTASGCKITEKRDYIRGSAKDMAKDKRPIYDATLVHVGAPVNGHNYKTKMFKKGKTYVVHSSEKGVAGAFKVVGEAPSSSGQSRSKLAALGRAFSTAISRGGKGKLDERFNINHTDINSMIKTGEAEGRFVAAKSFFKTRGELYQLVSSEGLLAQLKTEGYKIKPSTSGQWKAFRAVKTWSVEGGGKVTQTINMKESYVTEKQSLHREPEVRSVQISYYVKGAGGKEDFVHLPEQSMFSGGL